MKLYFGLENLRALHVAPPIELRPITILLGRNNVGKSAFLGTFPLLRQSRLRKQIGLLYWKGEVDFGDYNTAITQGFQSDGIKFSFGSENIPISKRDLFQQSEFNKKNVDEVISEIKTANLQILLKGTDRNAIREKTLLTLPELDIRVDFNFSVSGSIKDVLVNDKVLPQVFGTTLFEFPNNELLPVIRTSFDSSVAKVSGFREIFATNLESCIYKSVKSVTGEKVNVSEATFEVMRILSYPRLNLETISILKNSSKSKILETFYSLLENYQELLMELDTNCSLHTALVVYDKIASVFSDVIENATYIGPTRAKSKRYHEITNLDYSELRVNGENFPEMLGSIDRVKLVEFSDWLEHQFDFGISQLVPVALQVWWDLNLLGNFSNFSSTSSRMGTSITQHITKILAVEQPELHLHPARQAALADLFANSVKFVRDKKNSIKPVYIIETHSESLVNRMGELIEDGVVSSEDVQILMFSKVGDDLTSPTTVVPIEYNAEGYLEEWPYGFFRYKNVN